MSWAQSCRDLAEKLILCWTTWKPLRSSFFWGVTQRTLVVLGLFDPQKMGTTGCPERPVCNYQSILRKIPQERRCHLHRDGSLKSGMKAFEILFGSFKHYVDSDTLFARHIITHDFSGRSRKTRHSVRFSRITDSAVKRLTSGFTLFT